MADRTERKSALTSDALRAQIISTIERAGLTKGGIAREIGINRTGLSHFAAGRADLSVPVIEEVLSLAKARLVVQDLYTAEAATALSKLSPERYELALRAILALADIADEDEFEARYGVETLERTASKRQRRAAAA